MTFNGNESDDNSVWLTLVKTLYKIKIMRI